MTTVEQGYNLRPRPCQSINSNTGLPDRCRVTVFDVNSVGCGRSLTITTCEHSFGTFVGIGEMQCPDNMRWTYFVRLWVFDFMSAPPPDNTTDVFVIIEKKALCDRYTTNDDVELTKRNNERIKSIVRDLPVEKQLIVCTDTKFHRDMYFGATAFIHGGMNPLQIAEEPEEYVEEVADWAKGWV